VNYDNTKSFFCNIRKMLEIYELPKIHELQSNLPPKPKWKNLVNSTIKKYWTEKLKEETSGKTTLKFMSCDHLAIGDSHPVWKLPPRSRPKVRKGIVKSRIITGTYILQIDRHKFSQYNIDPNCPLCKTEEENLIRFLPKCPLLRPILAPLFEALKGEVISCTNENTWQNIFNNSLSIVRLIVDCRNFANIFNEDKNVMHRIEELSRNLCYALHVKRLQIMGNQNVNPRMR
jgi:hypothetical protein